MDSSLAFQIISLLRVERHRPQGIDLNDISQEFYKLFGKHLTEFELNYKSLYDLCQQLSQQCHQSVVIVEQNHNQFKTDRIFFDENAFNKWIQSFQMSRNVHFLEGLANYYMPSDVVRQNSKQLPAIDLPPEAMNKTNISSIGAKLISVESPDLMCIQLTKDKDIYQKLRQNMRFYDGINGSDYVLPKELAFSGYFCAVRNPSDWGNWHRAVITREESEDYFQLYAIDFGNTIYEERRHLRLLRYQYFNCSQLALRVSLSGIAPLQYRSGRDWSEEAIDFMKSFIGRINCDNSLGCIFIEQISYNFYSVILFFSKTVIKDDFSEVQPFYLHEKLIRKELAEMVHFCWSQFKHKIIKSHFNVFEEISEPLLAIKCEADFDEYQSPNKGLNEVKTKQINEQNLSENKISIKVESIDDMIASETPKELEIDYKRLYFTNKRSHELNVQKFFPKCHSFYYIELKFYSNDKSFPCYQSKYFIDDFPLPLVTKRSDTKRSGVGQVSIDEEYDCVKKKYITSTEDYFPFVSLKYMTLGEGLDCVPSKHMYFTKQTDAYPTVPLKYMSIEQEYDCVEDNHFCDKPLIDSKSKCFR